MKLQAHFMIDLETAGKGDNAAIIAIGCQAFNPITDEMLGQFYRTVDLESAMEYGGEVDGSTIKWWMKQEKIARKAAWKGDASILEVCLRLDDFMNQFCNSDPENRQVWGNGSDFDIVILRNAYHRLGLKEPWHYRGINCYRTLKKQYPAAVSREPVIKHHALHDAFAQAQRVCAIYKLRMEGGTY